MFAQGGTAASAKKGSTGMAALALHPWETLLFRTTPHARSFLRIWSSFGLLTVLWIAFLMMAAIRIPIENKAFWWFFIALTVAFCAGVFGQCRTMFEKNKPMIYICNFWVLSYVIVLTLLVMRMIHGEMAGTEVVWWEGYIGLPFSLAAILLSVLIFIISRVVWRIGYVVPKQFSLPLYAGSICLILVSLYSLLLASQFDVMLRDEWQQYMFIAFGAVCIAFSAVLVSFANSRGGIRYQITTKRIIITTDFIKHSAEDHLFDRIHDIELDQGFLGRRCDYGDVRIKTLQYIETKKGEKIHVTAMFLVGIPAPMLLKNTLLALTSTDSYKGRAQGGHASEAGYETGPGPSAQPPSQAELQPAAAPSAPQAQPQPQAQNAPLQAPKQNARQPSPRQAPTSKAPPVSQPAPAPKPAAAPPVQQAPQRPKPGEIRLDTGKSPAQGRPAVPAQAKPQQAAPAPAQPKPALAAGQRPAPQQKPPQPKGPQASAPGPAAPKPKKQVKEEDLQEIAKEYESSTKGR